MSKRIHCPYCKMHLLGEGFLQRHIHTIHNQISIKEEFEFKVKMPKL